MNDNEHQGKVITHHIKINPDTFDMEITIEGESEKYYFYKNKSLEEAKNLASQFAAGRLPPFIWKDE